MKATLRVKRYIYNLEPERNVIGDMYLNGEFFCYTLEDEVRAKGEKVYGKTAIPDGTYKVIVNRSNRFKRDMPLLLDVPMFEGIRIHSGNSAKDSSGCILVAFNSDGKKIWGTAEKELTKRLRAFSDIEITIENKFLTYKGKLSK